MDRTGPCMGNIFTECRWRPFEYEPVKLYEFLDGFQAKEVISR